MSTGKPLLFIVVAVLFAACAEIQRPAPEPFFAEGMPPAKQEFRWSNGRMPRSFDPAKAAAAPETDLVRALFEGLTEIDVRSLEAVPAVAEKWSSDDDRVWTFHLRKNARWSNGRRVTAGDFVTSWRRLTTLGDKTAHRELLQNIVGFQSVAPAPTTELPEPVATASPLSDQAAPSTAALPSGSPPTTSQARSDAKTASEKFGVEAIDDSTLTVTLVAADKDLPKLVAAPVFRPVYGDGSRFVDGLLDSAVITNGPFTVTLVERSGVSLERSETYWNMAAVKLEKVRFIAKDTAEAALGAYKNGEIDALTNAQLEPLALKLLAPYDDFRQATFGAVNLYKFDDTRPPFNDRRVREALAISIDRDRLVSSELQGAAEPATTFLAVTNNKNKALVFDPVKAKGLLESAGIQDGAALAPVRLVVNRNDTQVRIARAVARMWKQNLNLETEITVKEAGEMDAAEASHEFDLTRRGIVFPAADEAVSMWSVFGTRRAETKALGPQAAKPESSGPVEDSLEPPSETLVPMTITEEEALYDLHAIPLYFPRSYSLVKPYVHGFDPGGLDAVYLPGVSIDSSWQPKTRRRES